MTKKARAYTDPTIKKLFAYSGNRCAAPGCSRTVIARDDITVVAKICHIEAASPNGARYNASMTDEERCHFDNLILLCDECHSIIDNKETESHYTVDLLKSWKKNHESTYLQSQLKKTSLLTNVINAIAAVDFEESESSRTPTPFSIVEKIDFNNIKRNKFLIQEYAGYNGKLNSLYIELEKDGSFKKEKLLRNIRYIYLKVKGQYVSDSANGLSITQDNADDIIETVTNELTSLASKINMPEEDIAFGVSIVIVDAFMRCKILEEPTKTV